MSTQTKVVRQQALDFKPSVEVFEDNLKRLIEYFNVDKTPDDD